MSNYKIILLGNVEVGKTSLVSKLIYNEPNKIDEKSN